MPALKDRYHRRLFKAECDVYFVACARVEDGAV